MNGGVSDIQRALDAKKALGPSHGQEDAQVRGLTRRDYVGTTYCAPNVKLTPAE
jgi:hypothetical protein